MFRPLASPRTSRLSRKRPVLGIALATGLLLPTLATAAPVRESAQPLGVLGDGGRPTCAGPVSPFEPVDLSSVLSSNRQLTGSGSPATRTEVAASALAAEFAPAVSICSPTFAGIPGPITGNIASVPERSRVGAGWRDLGSPLFEPSVVSVGDVFSLPEVDDAATVTLSVAATPGRPAATIALSDLAPGPSRVAVTEDARGIVATLTRGDGSTAEGTVKPTVLTPLGARISGSAHRWKVTVRALPGTVVSLRNAYSDFDESQDGGTVTVGAAGTATAVLRQRRKLRKRESGYLSGFAVNRRAQILTTFDCVVEGDRRSRPTVIGCVPDSNSSILNDFGSSFSSSPFPAIGGSYYSVQRSVSAVVRGLAAKVAGGSAKPVAKTAPVAHRNAIIGRSAAPATAALVVRPVPRTPALAGAALDDVRPLAADVNGDGALDFWTDEPTGTLDWWPSFGGSAGSILVSGPQGLVAHRVDLPAMDARGSASESEISAIADVTGDGLGEVVVDIGERHVLIPGSRTWTGTTFPIRTADPAAIEPDEIVLAPSVSSPGAPYAALDDADGDGLRELATTDDLGGWAAFSATQIRRGTLTRLPTVARVPTLPGPVQRAYQFDPAVPRVDPRVRVIAGQAVSVRWPVIATRKAPEGTVEIAIRDARGTAVRPVTTIKTPGNALLLDYDRPSGEVLMLAVSPRCLVSRDYRRGRCRETLLRVRADGTVRTSVTVAPRNAIAYLGAARFLLDGPDADSDVDVAFTVGNQALGTITSTSTGKLDVDDLPTAQVSEVDRPFYDELRLIPVVEPSGARKLTVALPGILSSRGDDYGGGSEEPAEITWK